MKPFRDKPRRHLNIVTTFIMFLVAVFVLSVIGSAVYAVYLVSGFGWAFAIGCIIVVAVGSIFLIAWKNGMNGEVREITYDDYEEEDEGVG